MELFWLDRRYEDVPGGDEWLSAGERQTLSLLRVPKRRADWRLGRWTAKCAVSALRPDTAGIAEIEVHPAESGAPTVFIRGSPSGLGISLSHSGGRGFCVLTDEAASTGCDVEHIEPRSPEFIEDYFTPAEQLAIWSSGDPGRAELVNLLWSAKESVLKAMGLGLRLNPRSVVVHQSGSEATPSEWMKLQAATEAGDIFYGWWRSADEFVWTAVGRPCPGSLKALHCALGKAQMEMEVF
jgi:4'-phosphopantetheinyl transferase